MYPASRNETIFSGIFSFLFGSLLGFALIKFGNPVVLDDPAVGMLQLPSALEPNSPTNLRYWLLGILALCGLVVARCDKKLIRWFVFLPLLWLGWQFISATQTIDTGLTRATLKHFSCCAICFYLGLFSLSRVRNPVFFWLPITACFVWVLIFGAQQHFGGLADSRKYFYLYLYPTLTGIPPDFLKKISSDRIFSTLFYPNALAGVILLLLPGVLGSVWLLEKRLSAISRGVLATIVGLLACGCLFWSGSKAGWLIALGVGVVFLFRTSIQQKMKFCVIGVLLVSGLVGFFLKYADYFEKKVNSAGARMDYWRAAVETTKSKPLLGSGPGTFWRSYQSVKNPESEMARLAHNDYLQQASDSGLAGFLLYTVFIITALWKTFPKHGNISFRFLTWLGLLGWALQSFVEFGLYIPAMSWTVFALMGWLLAERNAMDNETTNI